MEKRVKQGVLQVLEGDRWRKAERLKCQWCGKMFVATIIKGGRRFCGRICGARATRVTRQALVKCRVCKSLFMIKASHKDRYKTCRKPNCKARYREQLVAKLRKRNRDLASKISS